MRILNESQLFSEMSLEEQKEVNGGGFLVGVLVGGAVAMVIDYWPDIKKAASDAWEGK